MFRIEHNVKTGEIKQIKLTEEEIIEVNNLAKEVEKRQKIQDKKLEELGLPPGDKNKKAYSYFGTICNFKMWC